jgi:flagellar biosynthesis/type III secretory pathway protein FliH
VLLPIVAGPQSVPKIRSRDAAMRNPELAVLSALAHAHEPDALAYAVSATEAMLLLDPESSYLFLDLIFRALRASDARILEQMMQKHHQFASPTMQRLFEKGLEEGIEKGKQEGIEKGIEKGLEQGIEKGKEEGALAAIADAILRVLAARNMTVPSDLEQRIRACHDMSQLDRWLELAATARSIDELTGE